MPRSRKILNTLFNYDDKRQLCGNSRISTYFPENNAPAEFSLFYTVSAFSVLLRTTVVAFLRMFSSPSIQWCVAFAGRGTNAVKVNLSLSARKNCSGAAPYKQTLGDVLRPHARRGMSFPNLPFGHVTPPLVEEKGALMNTMLIVVTI